MFSELYILKIFHVITTLTRGGAENHLFALVRGQASRGLQVEVAYLKGDGYWKKELQKLGVAVHELKLRYYGDVRPLMRLRKLLSESKPDIVHAHMPPAELYARVALLGHDSIPLVITKHNDERFCSYSGHAALGRWVVRRARRVIAISDAVNRYVRQYLSIEPSRIATVGYGIDPAPFMDIDATACSRLKREWGCSEDTWIIGTIARLVPQKGIDVLLKAYALYRSKATHPSRLVIVGTGFLEQTLKDLADRLQIASDVVWAGFREDIPLVMNTFDLFVLTSQYEGFGLVLLEAMASGKPVVATRVSAIPEVVQAGTTGMLCDPGSSEQVAATFQQFEPVSVRERFGLAGRVRVCDRFGIDQMVEQTLEIYKHV